MANRLVVVSLLIASAAALGALAAGYVFDVKLGQGYFHLRYTSFLGARLITAAAILLAAVLAGAAMLLLGSAKIAERAVAWLLLIGVVGAMALFGWLGAPGGLLSQVFNMMSPSHEGAFLNEAHGVTSAGAYLRQFDALLTRTQEQMSGTRVLSNPPGMTVLFHWMVQLWPNVPGQPDALVRAVGADETLTPAQWALVDPSVKATIVLIVLWAAAVVPAFAMARLFVATPAAVLAAMVIVFNPATLHFSPGKDPAQLLTICAMLFLWLAGYRTGRLWLSAAAGFVLMLGMTIGLVHAWVALAAAAATTWQLIARGQTRTALGHVIAASVGVLACVGAAYVFWGWNALATTLAVTRRYGEIQNTLRMSPAIWYAIGLPIFLLFLSPAVWTAALLTWRRRRRFRNWGFGRRWFVCQSIVMLGLYAGGLTYELPRLWIAFLPAITLSLMIDVPLFRGRTNVRAAKALALLLLIHLAVSSLHWTMLDVRESEHRLVSGRLYN